VATNVAVAVYNKSTCSLVTHASLVSLMGAASGEGLFDPQVLWDVGTGRFILTAESTFSGNANQNQWYAISKDNTGTTWWVYNPIPIINGSSTFCVPNSSAFWDYPHVGSMNG